MARSAVLCVLFACFAVAVYSQTCDPQTGLWSQVENRAIVVDATGVANVKGVLTIADGTGALSLDYQKSQGFSVTKAPGLVTVKRAPPKVDAASRLGGVSVLVTLGLAALALVSQRGSLMALVLALAIATAVIAACSTATTLEVTVEIDPAALDKFTLKLWLDPVSKACPPTGFTTAGGLASATPSELTIAVNGAACDIVWNNPLPGCPRCPAIPNQASVSCVAGSCEYTCDAQHRLCDGNCDVEMNDPANCGACGNDCSVGVTGVNSSICTPGGCDYSSCLPGLQDCDNNRRNGCETDVTTITACGSCKNDCTAYENIDLDAGVTCENGECKFQCPEGYIDCGGSSDGCESSMASDTTCGSCDNDCTSTFNTNAGPGTCDPDTFTCVYPDCHPGFGDCNSLPGCETSLDEVSACGSCDNNCNNLDNVEPGLPTCENGVCNIDGACRLGYGDCNGDPSDGCETQLNTVDACGACDKKCADASLNAVDVTCDAGTCRAECAPGFDLCDPTLNKGDVGCPNDVSSDAQNCGVCGYDCPLVENAEKACESGVCSYSSCNAGFQDCDENKGNGCESSINSDRNNCGGCGDDFDCEISGPNGHFTQARCEAAECALDCSAGWGDCDGDHKNGCEVNTFTSLDNCNGCGVKCSYDNAVSECVGGTCRVQSCVAPFAYCGTASPNTVGCPINLDVDTDNCGECGFSCLDLDNVNTGITCTGGVCDVATNCLSTHNDCDGNVANGCELPVSICTPNTPGGVCSRAQGYDNPAYNNFDCKSLNEAHNVVTAETFCATETDVAAGTVVGTCFIKCMPGFEDCNGDPTDGCENPSANCGSSLTSGRCDTALQDPQGPVSCLALIQDPTLNVTVRQDDSPIECDKDTGLCTYTCAEGYFDCDGSAKNGCEIDTRVCPINDVADCIFDIDTRCGYGLCADCTKLSGTVPGSGVCVTDGDVSQCDFQCNSNECRDADNDWSNGCEQAQGYLSTVGVGLVDCSKDIDLTNVLIVDNQPVYCDGNPSSPSHGRCVFSCKPGFADCDGSPFNGCETDLSGPCTSCDYQADVSCGKNKCVDCTLLEGTLGSDYANGRFASASASTCIEASSGLNERVTDFICDTSVHRLNPRFDPPNGENGACQSELCRDLDGNWENGCESAQQYGRGRFYFYGDSTLLDAFMVPYVPNPYEDRFYDYKEDFLAKDSVTGEFVHHIVDDIKFLNYLKNRQSSLFGSLSSSFLWDHLVGKVSAPEHYAGPSTFSHLNSVFSFPFSGGHSGNVLTTRDVVLLHYAPSNYTDVDEPAEAAALAIIGEPYQNPVDCVLSEWSDWGLCTYADDCVNRDYHLQTRIRTRKVITPASGGGVCHLPLVEDFYRFSHRNSDKNEVVFTSGLPEVDTDGNHGADWAHGGGFGYKVDYTNGYEVGNTNFDIMKILHFNAHDWAVETTFGNIAGSSKVNDPAYLSWTGIVSEGTPGNKGDLAPVVSLNHYARLLTCAPIGTCPTINDGQLRVECNITAWSEWSACSAACDGDWAGGVRIRTRTVITGAARNGECFQDEFDADGLPLYANSGMLYEEDWQCNDHSCSSFDCTQLRDPTFAAEVHIDLSADKITPTCDGRDWPAYVNGMAFVDANRDGIDDNTVFTELPQTGSGDWFVSRGNFPLWNTVYNFSYEYRWPGHCLYECEEGWFDCDHDPRNGCETSGDLCSIDVEYGSTAQLTHPLMPWEHPHGECTIAWKHDPSGVVPYDCTDYLEHKELRHTTGVCDSNTGLCDLTCDEGYANCQGDGCVRIDETYGFCGKSCVKCDQLNLFKYGYQSGVGAVDVWACQETDDGSDWECRPQTQCIQGCTDEDGNIYNGCETAQYKQWPYPDVTPFSTEMDEWSAWTPCTHADDCGYLWDMDPTTGGVFRNVPIQTRYRRPTKSAYNGGFYPDFSYVGYQALKIDGVSFPSEADFAMMSLTPELRHIRGVPLVQTPFYEVRICESSSPIASCLECTNQLVGLEEHCELSPWSDWSACSAECVDRIYDPVAADIKPEDAAKPRFQWNLEDDGWVLDRTPYQIRTRTVVRPARLGGRCPPPGDTWQLTEAASNVRLAAETSHYPNLALGELLDDSVYNNKDISAKASYLVDVRKCNTEECTYPEDCDALNYWYPGHFQTIATCDESDEYGEVSRCVATAGFADANGCSVANGYCDSVNNDLRDGCDTFVYPTKCGRVVEGSDACDYENFFDCTKLPGVISPYAAPCVINPDEESAMPRVTSFADMNSPAGDTTHAHICDIRWACNASLCTNSLYSLSGKRTLPNLDWKDGCEIARNYRYPFVTVESEYESNPMYKYYNYALNHDEEDVTAYTFWDPAGKYTLNAGPDNSGAFAFDCRHFLAQAEYCGADEIVEPSLPTDITHDDEVLLSYRKNEGCHLAGDINSNEFYDLGFGCNGVWNTPNAGMCILNCADGYYDADLDPRNGCETDTIEEATPEDLYIWVGNCVASNNAVDIKSDSSCGADKCVDCRALPGVLATGAAGVEVPSCLLAEELSNKVPVLNDKDYDAIMYACGIHSADTQPVYSGEIEFNDRFCNSKCVDGDNNWLNGCEQARGYTTTVGEYPMGLVYDNIFDGKTYDPETGEIGTCNADFTAAGGCDKRSSGFEFPIPGAWFYQNLPVHTSDTDRVGQLTMPADELTDYLDRMATVASYYPDANLDDEFAVTNKRAFDCSLIYSTELLYVLADEDTKNTKKDVVIHDKYVYIGELEGEVEGLFTFAQVHHINITQAPGGSWNNVCNRDTGLCNYVCQDGWDDYDGDPSNGCEADLSGPCGTPLARSIRKYTEEGSCGAQCINCDQLPGSYQVPIPKSACLALYPENFLPDAGTEASPLRKKHAYLVSNVRFAHACSTDIVYPITTNPSNDWQQIVCDPRLCYDANYKYEDGCETATNYPKAYLPQSGTSRKASFNHWFFLDSEGTLMPETTYWVRQDGLVVIGTEEEPSKDVGEYWTKLFDLQEHRNSEPQALLDGETTDYYFREWVVSRLHAYSARMWRSGEYNIFPDTTEKASYDCTNTRVPHGTTTVDVEGTTVTVEWTLSTEMPGPWFHVDQSASTECFAGPDPGAQRNSYSRGDNQIDPLQYCTPNPSSWSGQQYNKGCYDSWRTLSAGRCKLRCEPGWADGDMDPTNGCESYMANGYPYPASACGNNYNDPSMDTNYPSGHYNYNQQGSCGAGLCLNCKLLPGVNHDATVERGTTSQCSDGGDDWELADSGTPVGNHKYPGDYYCTDVINKKACLRLRLPMTCEPQDLGEDCPSSGAKLYPASENGGVTTTENTAAYLQVCDDRDGLWENGCEVALGYNVHSSTSLVKDGDDNVISVNYNRRIGVLPHYDNNFEVIDWADIVGDDDDMKYVKSGFDCDILRLLPRFHTHITPHSPGSTNTIIECSPTSVTGPGTCSFKCDNAWQDCDKNPWNGCETSTLLCSNCNTAEKYQGGQKLTCSSIPKEEYDRVPMCDGNQLPYDEWRVSDASDFSDAGYYEAPFDIEDHGVAAVDVQRNSVNPTVSRYTIKGLWDNKDIDAVCRIWFDNYSPDGYSIRHPSTDPTIPEDANIATGTCVIDCLESGGYSDCDGNDFNGCESHTEVNQCRSPDGGCLNCQNIPGIVPPTKHAVQCLSTKTVGDAKVPFGGITINWAPNPVFGIENGGHQVRYGTDGGLPAISSEFPQCDTRGASGSGLACDDFLCRDYDGDWENGCEFPMGYTQSQRASWETQQATYGPSGVTNDGFDCSWISDPQPDAGGRNYGGKTWAEKHHVNIDVKNGGKLGHCVGDSSRGSLAGKCEIVCMPGWSDCDGDPTNGCENDESLCQNCVVAKNYLDFPQGVNCSTLTDPAKGFIPFTIAPVCNGREGQDGLCARYMCNIFDGYCDSGLGLTLNTIGCVKQTADDQYCGVDWNWRAILGNGTTIALENTPAYEGGRMVDYGNFDGTGRCGTCHDLDGYVSEDAFCQSDATVAGHTKDKKVYYKPAASGWISSSLGDIGFETMGNTVGEYLCQLHAELDSGDDGACDRNLCVDEDYYWANGCETAVNYPIRILSNGSAGIQRHLDSDRDFDFGFDYHFAFNSEAFGRQWPYNAARDGPQPSKAVRSEIRGIWCPFLQFWSLSTDNYLTGDCNVFPCPHFHPSTITNWITCVNNATSPDAGKCNFQCNTEEGWKDCDEDPMTGCETDIFNDGTCGSECQKVECNALDGINPFYWSECVANNGESQCDLSVCEESLCRDLDGDWTNGCETAVNYEGSQTYNCRALMSESELARLHLASVEPCNGEPGHHWAGKCAFTCEPGWIDCDGDFENGCEHDGSLCQDCTKALGYVTHYDGANFWQFWGPANADDKFYSVIYGSYFRQNTVDLDIYDYVSGTFNASNADEHRALDQFAGPNVAYSKYHVPYVAAFDCSELRTIYPDHFTSAPITCDADVTSATAGRCVYVCDASKGYYDCDGDPRNGCEHESMHEACGSGGACRNCYYISGVDYPVDTNSDDINDGSRGPYGRGGSGAFGSDSVDNDVYADSQVKYFGSANTRLDNPDLSTSPLRLGCIKLPGAQSFTCNLNTCSEKSFCENGNQAQSYGWRDGCELAKGYDFGNFDCSLMGPDAARNDAPRDTTTPGTPSFHVRQKVGTVGCDSQEVATGPYAGKGAWRYILAETGHTNEAEQGRFAFDYDGLVELFMVNYGIDVQNGQTLSNLDTTVDDFVINRVRGGDKPGTCYYECEYGYEDCNGDPRDGCEVKISACRDGDGQIGWDWANKRPTNGCELALGYTREQLQMADPDLTPVFNCYDLAFLSTVDNTQPIYCRGGQDGNPADGTCQFTCRAGYQDCDGNPANGCETEVSDESCGCVNCLALPGTLSLSENPNDSNFAVSQSTCNTATRQCTVPCNPDLCSDEDGDWLNGCEVAQAYPTPRDSTPVGPFDCSIWAKDLLLAKKHHIDINRLSTIFCEGRVNAPDAGTCNYQAACVSREFGGLHDYQDCNGDPRDGCEDTQRWCQRGNSATENPRGTLSDLCSKATKYYVDNYGFNIRGEFVGAGLDAIPTFDCYNLGADEHVNVTDVYPYCDRDPTHLETRGDCVFVCDDGYANCNGDPRDGCEAVTSNIKTCGTSCVDCDTLPGISRTAPRSCVEDEDGDYKCEFTCSQTNCLDLDGKWQNGCERTANDVDWDGVFVNQADNMDCSVMNEEAKVNPELFRHHLHIDLSKPIVTVGGTVAAGSIFCNSDLVSGANNGYCYFECLPGFVNSDRYSYNGCETAVAAAKVPFGGANPDETAYRFPISSTQNTYGSFGGYMIGDYDVEFYIAWLSSKLPNSMPVTFPLGLARMNEQVSTRFGGEANPTPILWY